MEGMLFCGQCGAPVQNQVQPAQGQEQPLQAQDQPAQTQEQPVSNQTQPVQDPYPSVSYQQPAQYQNAAPAAGAVVPVTSKHKKTGIIIGITVAAVAVVVAIVFAVIALFGGRSYEKTVDRYMKSFMNWDIEGYIELIPDQAVRMLMEKNTYDSDERDEFIEDGQENMNKAAEELWGKDWKRQLSNVTRDLKYDIDDIDDISGEDFDEIQRNYRRMDIDVSEAMNVEVKCTMEGSESENIQTVSLIKIGNSWYLDFIQMNIGIYWD